jgi:predicted lipoprotein with Yx(FWY)xxD motif
MEKSMLQRTWLQPLVAALAGAACVAASAQTIQSGGLLRDAAGKTLYTFDKDAGGQSACYDTCATAWPPFLAAENAKATAPMTLHARKDGRMQWGWNGKPLYTFAGDAAAGEANGDGSGGVWHVVRPAAKQAAADTAPVPSKY